MLMEHISDTRFFQELKLKPPQLSLVMAELGLERASKDKYVVKYGDTDSQFFIVLDGSLSVWEPVKIRQMLKPLHNLRLKLIEAIEHASETLSGFSFRFHLDPFKVEAGRRPAYCRFEDFQRLCPHDLSAEFTRYLWTQFQLHRAVDTVS